MVNRCCDLLKGKKIHGNTVYLAKSVYTVLMSFKSIFVVTLLGKLSLPLVFLYYFNNVPALGGSNPWLIVFHQVFSM